MARPKIDEQYWFNFSEQLVTSSTERRNEAGLKLQNLLGWLWGVYTAGTAIGIGISKQPLSLGMGILIGLPLPFLLLGYWMAVYSQIPILFTFDPRAPYEIQEQYDSSSRAQDCRIKLALAAALVSALLVSLAVLSGSFRRDLTQSFRSSLQLRSGLKFVAVEGKFSPDTEVFITVRPTTTSSKARPESRMFLTSPNGNLQAGFDFAGTADRYFVTAEWREADGLMRTATRSIFVKSP